MKLESPPVIFNSGGENVNRHINGDENDFRRSNLELVNGPQDLIKDKKIQSTFSTETPKDIETKNTEVSVNIVVRKTIEVNFNSVQDFLNFQSDMKKYGIEIELD